MSYLLFFSSTLLFLLLTAINAELLGQCFYLSANAAAQDDRPCDPHSQVSLCCPTGWTCLSNHLCEVTDSSAGSGKPIGSLRRGSCTNPNWDNGTCGDFCLNEPVNDNDGTLDACGDNVFACASDANMGMADCAENQGVFTIPAGTAYTIIGQATGNLTTSVVPVSSSTLTTLSSVKSSTSHPISSITPPSNSSASATPPLHTNAKGLSGGAIGGICIGVAAIVLVTGVLFYRFCWRGRQPLQTQEPGVIEKRTIINTEYDDGDATLATTVPTTIPHSAYSGNRSNMANTEITPPVPNLSSNSTSMQPNQTFTSPREYYGTRDAGRASPVNNDPGATRFSGLNDFTNV